ncbi:MAG: chemotaxis protein MotB [Myxococcota bacterium]|jgi:chemotaxis protein MotB
MRNMLGILVLAFATTGCVGKAKYVELETAFAKLERKQGRTEAKSDKQLDALLTALDDMMKIKRRGLADVSIEDGRAVIGLDSDVLFASGSAQLTPEGEAAIRALAPVIRASEGRFQVEGHTDSDPIHTATTPDNWHLGADRAIAVVSTLVQAGVPATRVSAASFAQFQPVVPNSTSSNKSQNRRIEIAYVPELAEILPYKQIMDHARTDVAKSDPKKGPKKR